MPKNWKTTALGILTLGLLIAPVWFPQYAKQFQQTAAALTSVGLLAAKDHDQ